MAQGRILIVDDDTLVLAGLNRVFEDAGYYIKTASKVEEALCLVKNENFDIVYTDMVMPVMNGVKLCKEIKKISPKTEVVIFSGTPQGMLDSLMDFLKAGGRDEILRKPLMKAEMLNVTERILRENNIIG